MERDELLKQINSIFIEVLENPEIILTESTNADEIEEWDSLNHIQLVVEVEKKFSLRFTAMEIQSWNTVGEMIDCIAAKKK